MNLARTLPPILAACSCTVLGPACFAEAPPAGSGDAGTTAVTTDATTEATTEATTDATAGSAATDSGTSASTTDRPGTSAGPTTAGPTTTGPTSDAETETVGTTSDPTGDPVTGWCAEEQAKSTGAVACESFEPGDAIGSWSASPPAAVGVEILDDVENGGNHYQHSVFGAGDSGLFDGMTQVDVNVTGAAVLIAQLDVRFNVDPSVCAPNSGNNIHVMSMLRQNVETLVSNDLWIDAGQTESLLWATAGGATDQVVEFSYSSLGADWFTVRLELDLGSGDATMFAGRFQDTGVYDGWGMDSAPVLTFQFGAFNADGREHTDCDMDIDNVLVRLE